VERLQKDQWFAGFNDERYAVNIEISGLLYNFVQFQNTYDCCHSQLISVLIVHSTVSRRNRVLLSPPFCADTCIVYSRQDRSALTLILSFVVISVPSSLSHCLLWSLVLHPHPHSAFTLKTVPPSPSPSHCLLWSSHCSALTLTSTFAVKTVPPSPSHCLLWSLLFRPHPHTVFCGHYCSALTLTLSLRSKPFRPHPHTVLCGHHCSTLTLILSCVDIIVPPSPSHCLLWSLLFRVCSHILHCAVNLSP
jgi:hypothetical protein